VIVSALLGHLYIQHEFPLLGWKPSEILRQFRNIQGVGGQIMGKKSQDDVLVQKYRVVPEGKETGTKKSHNAMGGDKMRGDKMRQMKPSGKGLSLAVLT
jgi:hypothetical protein